MSDYRDKYVKCPFYVSQDARKIHCTGFSDDCYLHVAFPNAENKEAHVVVPFHQLSLAIGKEGQNARLAARLTGFKIDIKSNEQ